jgi:ABC-type transport system substrate-binding protein
MLKSKKWALLAGLMIISMVVAACQPQQVNVPVTVVVKETQQVQVVQTVEIALPTDTPAPSFSTPHPILGKLENRQGIAYCTDKAALIASVYPFLSDDEKQAIQMDTFIPRSHWAYTKPSESYAFDAEKGKALFESTGWTLAEGATFRTNAAGEEMSLKFTTTTAQFRQTWGAVFQSNMQDCGLRIVRFHTPASWWFGDTTGLARRDFELGAFAWVGQADPGGQGLYACDQIPAPENGWAGQNDMGWCNEAASTAIKKANNTLDRQERIDNYAITQEEFAKDMPSLPLFNRVETNATSGDFEGFRAAAGQAYLNWNAHEWVRAGKDTIVVALSQEPASLFSLVENAFVAQLAYSFISGWSTESENYDFKAVLLKSIPTLENGGAVLNTVEVKAGDKVVDANGDPVELAKGVKVKDADGNEVEFDGTTPIKMPQLVVTSSFLDGTAFSDGQPLTKADLELSDKIRCDKVSGATAFITCDRTASIEYPDDLTAVFTLLPGYLDPTYFLDGPGLIGPYAAHQAVSTGGTLADAAAKDWQTLAEVAESPLGVGPYAITEWVKGQSLTFVANEHYVLGVPKTKNLVIQIIQDTNQAIAQLITGDVDVVFAETTPGSEQTLKDAQAQGKVKVYIVPSGTWEHIDMALFVR